MRTIAFSAGCLALCSIAFACSSDDSGPAAPAAGGSAGGDAAVEVGGSGGSAGAAGTAGQAGAAGQAGTAGQAGEAGAAGAPAPPDPAYDQCDIMEQDCADPVNSKCTLALMASVPLSWCVPAWGDAALGESCTRPTSVAGLDTCAEHLICGNWGQPSKTERVCRALCITEGDCGAKETCVSYGEGHGVCLPGCAPFGTDCNSANQCAPTTNTEGKVDFFCNFVGTEKEGDSCATTGTCGAGLWCMGTPLTCHKPCDPVHPCAEGSVCYAMAQTPEGGCYPLDWTCLGKAWPAPVAAQAQLPIQVSDYVNGNIPLAGATVKACAASDPDCAAPLQTVTTGADGSAKLPVQVGASGFDGYIEVSAPNMVPLLRVHTRPLTAENSTTALLFGLASKTAYEATEAPSGFTMDWTRGQIEVTTYDCASAPAPGIVVSATGLDANSKVVYVANDWSKVDEAATSTTGAGTGVVLNAPGTAVDVKAARASDATVLGTVTVPLRAGYVTELRFMPIP